MFAGSLSLTVHGGLVLVAILMVSLRGGDVPVVDLTPIIALEPAPPDPVPGPTGPGTRAGAGTTPLAGELGHRGHDTPKRSMTRAPARRDPYADVVMGYDAPASADPGSATGGDGAGLGAGLTGSGIGDGLGFGAFGDGPGALGVPPPPASHARPPRPKYDYRKLMLSAVRQYAGHTVMVKLEIDPQGHVRKASVLRGIEPALDHQALETVRNFEFYPALRADGEPRWGTYRWDFVIDTPPPEPEDQSSLQWRSRIVRAPAAPSPAPLPAAPPVDQPTVVEHRDFPR